MSEPTPVMQEMKRAVLCLAIEVPESIHRDIRDKWNDVVEYVERLRAELAARDGHDREQRAAELREAAEFLRHPKHDGLDVYTIHQLCIELDNRADRIEASHDE